VGEDARYREIGDFSFSRFGFIVQTDRQTDRQTETESLTDRITDANDCYTHATTVGVRKYGAVNIEVKRLSSTDGRNLEAAVSREGNA